MHTRNQCSFTEGCPQCNNTLFTGFFIQPLPNYQSIKSQPLNKYYDKIINDIFYPYDNIVDWALSRHT